MTIDKFIDRAANIVGSYGNFRTTPDQVDAETVALARCALANQELDLFTRFCYQQTDNGRFINWRAIAKFLLAYGPRGAVVVKVR